jgi:hypothetical protein
MSVRMKEVASRAGVSVKTVSNVVNGYLHVAPSTRERVQRAIDEMGYRPNLSARSLRSGRTGIIAVAVPRLDEPYFAELAAAVIGVADEHGCTVPRRADRRGARARAAGGRRHPARPHRRPHPQPARARCRRPARSAGTSTPLVLLGERSPTPATTTSRSTTSPPPGWPPSTCCPWAAPAWRRSGRWTPHRPDRASSPRRLPRGHGRPRACRSCPPRAGGRGLQPPGRRSSGRPAARPPERPDAVFCFNDLLRSAPSTPCTAGSGRAGGRRRPRHRRHPREPFSTPTLSTSPRTSDEIARLAVTALLQRLSEGVDDPPQEVTVPHRLRVRGSTVRAAVEDACASRPSASG